MNTTFLNKNYNKTIDISIFGWFDINFGKFIDKNIEGEDLNILLKYTKRCFRELLYSKILKTEYIDKYVLLLLRYTCLSISLKHILGYDWLRDEYSIIVEMTNNLILQQKISDMEFEMVDIIINLKCIPRIYNKF